VCVVCRWFPRRPSHPLSLPGYITGCAQANNSCALTAKLFLVVFAHAHTFVQHSPLQSLCMRSASQFTCTIYFCATQLFAVFAHANFFVHHNSLQSLRMCILLCNTVLQSVGMGILLCNAVLCSLGL
jgi:hypothetical protein